MLRKSPEIRIFLIIVLSVLAVEGIYLLNFEKLELHRQINLSFTNPYADLFFKYATHLGDGFTTLIVGILLYLFRNRAQGLFVLFSYGVSSLIVVLLKNFLFQDEMRPAGFLEYYPDLHFVEGVTVHNLKTLPSGHAASALALFTCLAFIFSGKKTQFILAIVAVMVAFSRVYLSQHFLRDIFWGSTIGCFTAVVMADFFFLKWKKMQSGNWQVSLLEGRKTKR